LAPEGRTAVSFSRMGVRGAALAGVRERRPDEGRAGLLGADFSAGDLDFFLDEAMVEI